MGMITDSGVEFADSLPHYPHAPYPVRYPFYPDYPRSLSFPAEPRPDHREIVG